MRIKITGPGCFKYGEGESEIGEQGEREDPVGESNGDSTAMANVIPQP